MECPVCRTASIPDHGICPQCGPPTAVVTGFADTALEPSRAPGPPNGPSTGLPAAWADTGTAPGRPPGRPDDATGPLAVGQAFGSRYHIIRLLGAGGMGAVYQAWDAELGVAVAIKVIRPSILARPEASAEVERRFKRELLLARQVTHTNVVRIHDLGEIDGIKYITMSYVNGLDLATRLVREGRQSVRDTLRMARAIVSGLAAAHAAGVVHRDLKPANIMIDADGEALIMDFGIAHSMGTAPAPRPADDIPDHLRQAALTAATATTGAVVGTIEYMAPEQARGEAVDQRTDIYAFGLILYDALLGRRRAGRDDAIEELQRRLSAPPPRLHDLAPDVPQPLADLIMRCVEPDVTARYQTTRELAGDLSRLDEEGQPIPIRRVVGLPLAVALVVMLTGVSAGSWWYARPPAPPPDPVAVVVADFDNRTTDAAFDQTLEPMVRRALEEAGFISAYDRSRIRPVFGVQPGDRFDEEGARELAVTQGLGVVLSGAIRRAGSGYEVSLRAAHPVTREVIGEAAARAAKDQVIEVTTRLVTRVRKALGDRTSDSAQLFAMRTISASSLEAVGHYAAAVEAQAKGRYEEAREAYLNAVAVDPEFGLAYQGLAVMSRNLGLLQDAETYIRKALRYLDGMTDRERFSTRGYYYRINGDYDQCAKEYADLILRYPADTVARSSRATCLARLRKMHEALAEMRQAVVTLPRHVVYRGNLAMLAAFAGDFELADREARAIDPPTDLGTQALAFAQLGQGLLREAADTYRRLATISARAASAAASGLGDLALYEGRFADAAHIFAEGATRDAAAKNATGAATKLTSLAHAELARGNAAAAIAAAGEALGHSTASNIQFLSARIFAEAGQIARARPLAAALSAEAAVEPRAYGKLLEGLIALRAGNAQQAIATLLEANEMLDTWLGHFDLGRAYLAAGDYLRADAEFDRCAERRGEALALLADDPTYGYFPPVYYYRGRAREALGTAAFADSYREYLRIRGASEDDPVVPELRRYARP